MREPVRLEPVTVVLDKARHLFVDLNALDRAEQITGKNLLDPRTWPGLNAGDRRALIWACLLRHDPDLKIEYIGAYLHPGNIREVMDKVTEAVLLSMPKVEKKEEGEDGEEDPPKPPES
jgi:hypothetical protein